MKVAVGLSGGVDSSVAAAILKKQGHEVVGIMMRISDDLPGAKKGCYGTDHSKKAKMASAVAETLGMPFHVLDLSKEYQAIVMDYFVDEYVSGRTPNPCLRCNPRVKFGAMLEKALSAGIQFEKFATGHYARVEHRTGNGRWTLKRALDSTKDQSYGLIFLTQEQLGRTLFPLGGITKKEVRRIAKDIGLGTHDEPDSQDFYDGNIADLIAAEPKPGDILDTAGNTVGTHDGVWRYTVGQRRGLGIPSGTPLYVRAIDAERNVIIVGEKSELYSEGLVASNINFVSAESIASGKEYGFRIRHTQEMISGSAEPLPDGRISVKFREPQWAVAPGQAVGIYDGDAVVAGGIIEESA
ncbi:MAG: tRNA 2-thiouridine(34) synthase MnmA [Candidatus Thermoplasmatota archaeon]|nr:tRNA 2-thiouridine(34) synthase MnmA [Euryarchaeota archaeon]MBU4032305.1 tRNA 2-thiouridine(34) synthase MnmA [Candidatus Thermoplasmatota archaeon]MBU4071954.1 tRNA 2-thiouridine(34) synthase MnmA [Candidatus Thermoplasmatota archaeon]MBU4143644.1 tRNA 2-thiouridine(34) synthase MnmA [Candidatus Thermoplasmatota archaeon]MBU4591304.1 tRNA 2-thiouridine(34) synthase MnmA [Candidatus Thermoplasmatota archaeon]